MSDINANTKLPILTKLENGSPEWLLPTAGDNIVVHELEQIQLACPGTDNHFTDTLFDTRQFIDAR